MTHIIIISGPSGAGKSSLCDELFKRMPNLYFSISSTTRTKRDGEIDGVHYNFIAQDEFENGIKNGIFLEWAKVHNHYYGTQKSQIARALGEGKIVIFDVDVQGQKSLKKHYPSATSIFITTPNIEILESRLKTRAKDSDDTIAKRLEVARSEIREIALFDYVIINDDFARAFEGFFSIIKSLAHKNTPALSDEIIARW